MLGLFKKSSIQLVTEFHKLFGHPIRKAPFLVYDRENTLRLSLIEEEVKELKEALKTKNELEVFDALLDIQYVLDGAFLALGYADYKDAGLAEVHRSNLSKLGEDGKPVYREDGKILKGPNFSKPDLKKVLDA